MRKIFEFLLYFFILCPFIFPIGYLGTDLQPYALFLSIIYLLIFSFNLKLNNKVLIVLGLYLIYSLLIGLVSETEKYTIIKCFYSYFSLFIISFASYNLLLRTQGIKENYIKIIIILWLIVGLIQLFSDYTISNNVISGSRTSSDRGVYGLASEPSFFGVQCFYFLFLVKSFSKEKDRILFTLIIVLMSVFLAQSFTGIMFILAFLIPYYFEIIKSKKINLRVHFLIFAVLIIGGYLFNEYVLNKRLGILIQIIQHDSTAALIEDESAFIRYHNIIEPLKMSIDNFFFPRGFSERIGSLFGGILLELGFLGIPLMILIASSFSYFFSSTIIKYIAFTLFFIIFFSTIQLSNPMIAFIIALSAFYKKKHGYFKTIKK